MVLDMKDIRNALQLGLVFGAIAWILSFVVKALNLPTANITLSTLDINVREQIVQGVDSSAGGKVLSFLGGVVPSGLEGILTIFISSFLIVLVGTMLFNIVIRKRGSPQRNLTLIMLFGTVALSFVIPGMTDPALNLNFLGVLVALLIYYGIVTAIVLWLSNQNFAKGFVKIPKI